MSLRFPTSPAAAGRPFVTAGFAFLLAACLPGPDYRPPQIDLPVRYSQLVPAPVVGADLNAWWKRFGDPVLDALIARGMSGNVSVAVAKARLHEAEAQARRAGYMLSGSFEEALVNGTGVDTRQTTLGLSTGIFGGQRRAAEAAFARLQAAGYGVQDARLKLLGQIAQAYVDLRFYQASLAQQQKDLVSRRKTLADIRVLLKSGEVTRLDELRAQALISDTQTQIPQTRANISQQVNRIATLTGTPAGALGLDLRYKGHQPVPRIAGPVGVPADLVRRRPDIREAERGYAAAVADIGTAVGARYPSLSLSGQIVAPRVSGYLTSSTLTTGLILPLFDQPALAAGVDAARARADQAYQSWRGAVLSAVEGVETALAQVEGARQAVGHAQTSVHLNTEALSLSQRMLEGYGSITVIDVLDRERAVTDSTSALAQARRGYADSAIALYTALGLGSVPQAGAPDGQGAQAAGKP